MNGEIVPSNISEKDLKDEVNRRTARAGYTTRAGESPYRTKIMNLPPTEAYRKNFDKIKWR